jgi:hypothetical protein
MLFTAIVVKLFFLCACYLWKSHLFIKDYMVLANMKALLIREAFFIILPIFSLIISSSVVYQELIAIDQALALATLIALSAIVAIILKGLFWIFERISKWSRRLKRTSTTIKV